MNDANFALPCDACTLTLKRELYGDEHPTTLSTHNKLCYVLASIGDFGQGVSYGHKSLEGRKVVLGDGDPKTFVSLLNLARAMGGSDQHGDAVGMLVDGVALAQERLGPQHPTTMDFTSGYARTALDSGDNQDADREIRAILEQLLTTDPQLSQRSTIAARTISALALRNPSRSADALALTGTLANALDESGRESHIQ